MRTSKCTEQSMISDMRPFLCYGDILIWRSGDRERAAVFPSPKSYDAVKRGRERKAYLAQLILPEMEGLLNGQEKANLVKYVAWLEPR